MFSRTPALQTAKETYLSIEGPGHNFIMLILTVEQRDQLVKNPVQMKRLEMLHHGTATGHKHTCVLSGEK